MNCFQNGKRSKIKKRPTRCSESDADTWDANDTHHLPNTKIISHPLIKVIIF